MRKEDLLRRPWLTATEEKIAELIQRLQRETCERERLRRRRASGAELAARERALERLRWQLAAVARRAAYDELGNAA